MENKRRKMDNAIIHENVGGWQNQMTDLSSSVAYLFNNERMSDVHFKLKHEGQIVTMYGHKFILAIRSEVFDAMFNGPCKQITENPEIVTIEDITYKDFFGFLHLLYIGNFWTKHVHHVCGVLYSATKYRVPGAINFCRHIIQTKICPAKIFTIKRLCTFIYPEVIERCWDVIEKEAKTIIQRQGFLSIGQNELCEFLERDGLLVSELELFNAVIKWAGEKCKNLANKKKLTIPETQKDIRDVLGKAFYLIRFPKMSLSDISLHVIPMKLLTTQEAHDILYYLALKAGNNHALELPESGFNCVERLQRT